MASITPVLNGVAPKLTRQLFQRLHRPSLALSRSIATKRPHVTPLVHPRSIRPFKTSPQRTSQAVASTNSLGGQKKPYKRSGFFPKTSEKVVAYWLLGSAASVFGIVVFGGLTRLTESGYA